MWEQGRARQDAPTREMPVRRTGVTSRSNTSKRPLDRGFRISDTSYRDRGTKLRDQQTWVEVHRGIRIRAARGSCNLQILIRAEFFNAFEHAQFNNPNGSFTSSNFGRVTSARSAGRIGQVSAKFLW